MAVVIHEWDTNGRGIVKNCASYHNVIQSVLELQARFRATSCCPPVSTAYQ